MKNSVKKLLFWTPRITGILFAVFISLFALDVFSEGYDFWHTVLALVMHLIPTFIIVVFLVLAWRWEWIGAVLFAALAILYPVLFWGRFPVSIYVIMTLPIWFIAVLFALNGKYRSIIHSK